MPAFTPWTPLPEVPRAVHFGGWQRAYTTDENSAKYYRFGLDIRHLLVEILKIIHAIASLVSIQDKARECMTREMDLCTTNEERELLRGVESEWGAYNKFLLCKKRNYERMKAELKGYITWLQRQRKLLREKLGWLNTTHPKEIYLNVMPTSEYWMKIHRIIVEQDEYKWLYSQQAFDTEEERKNG